MPSRIVRLWLDKNFGAAQSESMKETKGKSGKVLWTIAGGFSFILMMSWLTEILRIPHLLFGESFEPNWKRAILRTVVISVIWIWVHLLTRRLLARLHHLEGYLRICSWCRKVSDGDEWLDMETFFNSKFATKTSHGVCPGCLQKQMNEIGDAK
jgi:hypothetical protein